MFSSKTAGVEDDVATLDVAAKAEASELEAILAALCGRYPSEFQNIRLTASVMRIGARYSERLRIDTSKLQVLAVVATEKTIELRNGADRKGRRQGFLRS